MAAPVEGDQPVNPDPGRRGRDPDRDRDGSLYTFTWAPKPRPRPERGPRRDAAAAPREGEAAAPAKPENGVRASPAATASLRASAANPRPDQKPGERKGGDFKGKGAASRTATAAKTRGRSFEARPPRKNDRIDPTIRSRPL